MAELLLKDVNEDSVRNFLEDARGDESPEVTDEDVERVLAATRSRRSFVTSRPFEEQIELREQPVLTSYDPDNPPPNSEGGSV